MADQGAVHCDADRLVHRMYDPGTAAFDRIAEIFGKDVVGEDGYIDRRILGGKVFGKPEEMSKLTSAIGSIADAVKRVIDDWNETLGANDIALIEAVNLVEAGYGRWCSRVWLFACDQEAARSRLVARNQFTKEEVEQRLASQRPWEDRAPAADLVIFNNGTEDEFTTEVRSHFDELIRRWQSGILDPTKYLAWCTEFSNNRD